MVEETTRREGEDHGFWTSGLQKRRFARSSHARSGARPGQAHRKRELGGDLREARRSDGSGKRSLRECRSLRGAGFLDAWIQTGVEHAAFCGITRRRLVRTRDRAARQQSTDSSALALHRPETPKISRPGEWLLRWIGRSLGRC